MKLTHPLAVVGVLCFSVAVAIRHYDSREVLGINGHPDHLSSSDQESIHNTRKRRPPMIGALAEKWKSILQNQRQYDDVANDGRHTGRMYQDDTGKSPLSTGTNGNEHLFKAQRSHLSDSQLDNGPGRIKKTSSGTGPKLGYGYGDSARDSFSTGRSAEQEPYQPIAEQVHQFFFSGFEAARISYFGAALKYFTDQFSDIHSYSYITGPSGEKSPEFCGKFHCAKFEILCRNEFYEVRYYYGFTVATARVNGIEFVDSGLKKAYYKIIRYFGGENDKRVKIPWTVPNALLAPTKGIGNPETQLLELIKGGEGPAVNVALPPKYGTNTPVPDDPDIVITKLPDHVVYVRMFGGYALPYVFASKSKEFAQILLLKGHNVTGPVIAGIYNDPTTFVNRHNELYYFIEKDLPYEQYC